MDNIIVTKKIALPDGDLFQTQTVTLRTLNDLSVASPYSKSELLPLNSQAAWREALGIVSDAGAAIPNVVYVRPDGDDTDDGHSVVTAVASLEQAMVLANQITGSKLVLVYPGIYYTQGHIDIPDTTSVIGMGAARQTKIKPVAGYEERNVFRLGSGSYVEGFSFEGFRVDSLTNPTEGFAISFRPGATILRVPYVHNITVYRGQAPNNIAPPLDRDNGNPLVGRGAGCVLADASVLSQNSVFPNIMAWGATPTTPNGIGYCAKNGAVINAINAISIWAHKHFLALSGGRIILNGCSSQFGDYSVWSEGNCFSLNAYPTAGPLTIENAAAQLLVDEQNAIINYMWTQLQSAGLVNGWSAELEAKTRRDAATYLLALRYAFLSSDEQSVRDFTRGLYSYAGVPVFNVAYLTAFTSSFTFIKDKIIMLGVTTSAQNMLIGLTNAVINSLENPRLKKERSLVVALGHQVTAPLSGVNKNALPSLQRRGGISRLLRRSIVEREGGRVVFDAQDDSGNRIFAGGMTLDARTGRLGGRPFDLALQRTADDAAIAGSF